MGGQERIIKRYILSSVTRCQACHHHYDASCIQILSRDDDFWLTMVVCPRCRSRGLVAAIVKEQTPARPLSDLTDEERDRFRKADPITTDDVLSIHDDLDHFDGDFTTLFSPRRS